MLKNQTIRQYKKKNSIKQIKANNIYNQPYDRFNDKLNFLKTLNQIIPESLKSHQKINLTNEEIQKLGINELEELKMVYKSLIDTAQNPVTRSIKVKSRKVSRMLINKLINAYYVPRINEFIREMSLVYIITVFEQYLSEVLTITLKLKPEIMKSSKKQITYEELFNYKDFDGVKEKIVEREVDTIISQDIEKINSNLARHFRLDLSKNQHWSTFKEYFYRRHIIIHNNSCPDEKYRKKTGYQGKQKKLSITKHYLSAGIKLFEAYNKITQSFFIKKFDSYS